MSQLEYYIELEIIGTRLYHLRIARKESLKEVATVLQIPAMLLSKIENGKYDMKVDLFCDICNYYKVKPSEIVA